MATNQSMFSNRYVELSTFKSHLRKCLNARIGNQEPEQKTSTKGKTYTTIDITCTDNDKTILRWIYCTTRNGHTYLLKDSILERAKKDLDCKDKPWGQYYYEDRAAVLKACETLDAPPPVASSSSSDKK